MRVINSHFQHNLFIHFVPFRERVLFHSLLLDFHSSSAIKRLAAMKYKGTKCKINKHVEVRNEGVQEPAH